MKMKPILCGMNNPLSTRPGHELYPAPEGCTGHRLWQMLHARTGASRLQYLEAFERRNLVRGLEWNRLAARARAHEIVCELRDSGRVVVLLGQSVREAFDYVLKDENKFVISTGPLSAEWTGERSGFGLPPLLVHPQEAAGVTWRQIPHPSGRNLWYNEPENRKVVELLMEELYVGHTGSDEEVRARLRVLPGR
jgi:hypothetical protein